jgi:prepilin-type processing-associated H-X9-DG protein
MESDAAYRAIDIDKKGIWNTDLNAFPWTPAALELAASRPSSMVCPSDSSDPINIYWSDPLPHTATSLKAATGSYAVCIGDVGDSNSTTIKCKPPGMFMYARQRRLREVIDGTSKTFAAGEVQKSHTPEGGNPWTVGNRITLTMRSTLHPLNTPPGFGSAFKESDGTISNGAFGSEHKGGANFLYVDGHVTFISENVQLQAYWATSTVAGPSDLAAAIQ